MGQRLARVAIGLAILLALLYSGLLDLGSLAFVLHEPGLLLLAGLLTGVSVLVAALRWWVLLRRLDFSIPLIWAVRTILACQFLSTFMPGAYGADVVRIGLTYRAAGDGPGRINRLGRITVTVLVDRLSGLVALLLLGVAILPMLPGDTSEAMFLPLATVGAVILGGALIGLLLGERVPALLARLPGALGRKLARAAREVRAALGEYLGRLDALVAALALSLVQFALVVAALTILGEAMQFTALSRIGYAIAGILAIVANAIPLTPGGLGIGETAFAQIAVMLESADSDASYATVFLAMRGLSVLVSVLGIVPYLALRGEVDRGLEGLSEAEAQPSEGKEQSSAGRVRQSS